MTYKAQLNPWCIIRPFPNRTYAFAPLGRVFKPFDPPHAPLKKLCINRIFLNILRLDRVRGRGGH